MYTRVTDYLPWLQDQMLQFHQVSGILTIPSRTSP